MADDIVGVADEGNVVGAPLPQATEEWKPMLAGFGEGKVVTVFNPLSSAFRFKYARSVPQQAPLSKEAQVAQEKGGIAMNKDQGSVGHYANYWVLEAGESKNLPGDIAQKAVQDLVTYILMQRAGKGNAKQVSDGYARGQVEKEIVIAVHDNVSYLNSMTPQEATDKQVEQLNHKSVEESPDPPLGQGATYESAKVGQATRKA